MTEEFTRPTELQINAWNPDLPNRDKLPERTIWGQQERVSRAAKWLAPAAPVDERRWDHPDVGWGLVLPDDDTLPHATKCDGGDAPAPIRKLLQARPGSPVFRWSGKLAQYYLRRYCSDGRVQDLSIAAPKPGIRDGYIPRYLLIYATPEQIPWSVQYGLNMSSYVGRLDLTVEEGLEHYIDALVDDWSASPCKVNSPVVWSVDLGAEDITWLMARAVADRLWQHLEADTELAGRVRLKGEHGNCGDLLTALTEHKPGLIVTTSHGMTGPLHDTARLKQQLGLPVDIKNAVLRLNDMQSWKPSGAIWYAHACCSAGADSVSRYATLLASDGSIGQTVNGVASAAGAMVAPLPRALMGRPDPLRAFVGHVEPTFDWTLRDPTTKQVLTHVLSKSLYTDLFQQDMRTPIGYALRKVYDEAGAFYGLWQDAITKINTNVPKMRDWALYRQLAAMDRQTLVIIGDPTVGLPLLG